MQPPNISLLVDRPLWATTPTVSPTRINYPMNYKHTISALGGYWSMSWKEVGQQADIEKWLGDGIGRHIIVYNDALKVCWEGFVNQITAPLGPLSVTRGPLIDIGNRVYVVYTNLYSDFDPPANGTRDATTVTNDLDSQRKWGIQYKVVDGGSLTQLTAEYLRDTWITESAEPLTSQNYSGGSEMSATIECLGYWHLLNWPYNQVLYDEDDDLSRVTRDPAVPDPYGNPGGSYGKMQLVLQADPNNIFPENWTGMDNNTMNIPRWENQDNLAQSLLQSMTSLGDTTRRRYICGIYAGRKCHYNAAPTDVTYHQYLLDPQQRITTPFGAEVKPWDILPGKWLFYPDRNIGRTIPSTRRLDDRFEFIESVTYDSGSSPSVSHIGGKIDRLPQLLARWAMLEA